MPGTFLRCRASKWIPAITPYASRTLTIPRPVYQQLLAHLQAVYPAEGCGFLAGRAQRVSKVFPIDNLQHSPTAYTMDPRQQVETLLAIEDAGLELLAIFHSHPQGSAEPSSMDMARANYPEALQLIIALGPPARPVARLYAIEPGRVTPVTLHIE